MEMGRTTTVHRFDIIISDEGGVENSDGNLEFTIPEVAQKFVEKKFKTFPFELEENQLTYRWPRSQGPGTRDFYIDEDPTNLALMILNLEYKWVPITGTFTYEDNQTGGSSHGIVYFLGGKAVHYEFDTDFNEDTAATHQHQPKITKLTYKSPLAR